MPRKPKRLLPRWMTFSVSIILIGGLIALVGGLWWWNTRSVKEVTDFESCKQAGYPIMESFPEQCRTPDGRLFVRILSEDEKKNLTPPVDYYGSSTNATCRVDNDCSVQGCNSEICGGKDEGLSSICVAPNQPLPRDLGYNCQCVISTCQWTK